MFHFDQNVNIFEAFHLTLVKRNHQNRECRKRTAKGKCRAVNGWKRIDHMASFVHIQPLNF